MSNNYKFILFFVQLHAKEQKPIPTSTMLTAIFAVTVEP